MDRKRRVPVAGISETRTWIVRNGRRRRNGKEVEKAEIHSPSL